MNDSISELDSVKHAHSPREFQYYCEIKYDYLTLQVDLWVTDQTFSLSDTV